MSRFDILLRFVIVASAFAALASRPLEDYIRQSDRAGRPTSDLQAVAGPSASEPADGPSVSDTKSRFLLEGREAGGWLTASSPRLPDGRVHDVWLLKCQPDAMWQVDLVSDAFDAFLQLRDLEGAVIQVDDDSGGGSNSRLTRSCYEPTTYEVVVTHYPGGTSSGSYRLRLTRS